MAHRISWLDVFAERALAGNGLAVVDDADDVSDETMLALAQETRLSETTFVQSTEAEGADYRNRIWDPHEELPFAGHPSLGTAVAVARWRGLDEAGFVQETRAGLQPIEVRQENGSWRASMLQNEAEFGPELDRDAVMSAVGLRAEDAHPELAPQVVSTGLPHVMAPVSEHAALVARAPRLLDDLRALGIARLDRHLSRLARPRRRDRPGPLIHANGRRWGRTRRPDRRPGRWAHISTSASEPVAC